MGNLGADTKIEWDDRHAEAQFVDQRCGPLARVRVRLLEHLQEATVRYRTERPAIGHGFAE